MYLLLIKFFAFLNNFSYEMIKQLAVKASPDGIHPKHRIMNYHKFFVDNINVTDSVLDIGCGNGAVAYDIAKKAKDVTAIDFNENSIRKAKKMFQRNNILYLQADATKYNFNRSFDVITLSNVLEHIENRLAFLSTVRGLAPKILIRVPMINRDWLTPYKKEIGVEWRLDNTHFTEYTLDQLTDELSTIDLKIDSFSIQFAEIWAVVSHKE